MKIHLLLLLFFTTASHKSFCQSAYADSMNAYIANYVARHEVVKKQDKQLMQFFPVDEKFLVVANIQRAVNSEWITFKSSGIKKKVYRLFGTLHFKIDDQSFQLELYQSQDLLMNPQYRDFLFLAFTDATTGDETYKAGRYIDLKLGDIINNTIVVDFNKAYNPYCAYVSGVYNCPLPPPGNHLPIAITAGEKNFNGN